jgi:hypothetical protein
MYAYLVDGNVLHTCVNPDQSDIFDSKGNKITDFKVVYRTVNSLPSSAPVHKAIESNYSKPKRATPRKKRKQVSKHR